MLYTQIYRFLLISLLLSIIYHPVLLAGENQDAEFEELMQEFDNTDNIPDEESLDDLLEGFEEPAETTTATSATTAFMQRNWDLITLISLSSSYNYQQKKPVVGKTDYRGLSRLKIKLQPELRYKFNQQWDTVISVNSFYDAIYALNGRNQYTAETLDTYETQLEFGEAYIRGTLTDSIDMKVGRQIVVWGKSDSIRVVDILNPLDFREPGMVDIEDLRLPVTMFKMDYYYQQWNFSAIVVPEIRFNKLPAYGSDFYIADRRLPPETVPDDLKNFETALALEGIFSGWDLSFYLANYYDDQAHMDLNNGKPVAQTHSKLNLLGAATNIAFGDWLLKMESAFISGIEFASTSTVFSRVDLLLGVDYSGFTDTILSLETVNRKLLSYESLLATSIDQTKENEGQIVFRYSGNFIHDEIKIIALAVILGNNFNGGAYYRGSIKYDIMDATSISLGAIIYQSGDNYLLQNIAQNDRVFFDVRYSF